MARGLHRGRLRSRGALNTSVSSMCLGQAGRIPLLFVTFVFLLVCLLELHPHDSGIVQTLAWRRLFNACLAIEHRDCSYNVKHGGRPSSTFQAVISLALDFPSQVPLVHQATSMQ